MTGRVGRRRILGGGVGINLRGGNEESDEFARRGCLLEGGVC